MSPPESFKSDALAATSCYVCGWRLSETEVWPTERAIAIDPLDEEHYFALHRVLADAGRHGAVDRVLTRSPLGHGHRAPRRVVRFTAARPTTAGVQSDRGHREVTVEVDDES